MVMVCDVFLRCDFSEIIAVVRRYQLQRFRKVSKLENRIR